MTLKWGLGRWKEKNPDSQTSSILLMFLETSAVVFIKNGVPGRDVDDGHSARDEQHEGELHHVADLHQHDGGDEGQHGNVVVILGVLHAAVLRLRPCGAIVGSRVVLEAAQLEARTVGRTQGQGDSRRSEKAVMAVCAQLPLPAAPLGTPRKMGKLPQGTMIQMLVIPTESVPIIPSDAHENSLCV